MRVFRGRGDDPAADREATAAVVEQVAATGEPALRVWTPHRQIAFGRRDVRSDGYGRAAAAARDRGFDPVERSVGGRAVAYTGSTVAFARAEPIDDVRSGMQDRYDAATAAVRTALRGLGVPAEEGEPDDAFCPGQHSLQAAGKVAGIAQRVRTDAALVGGVVVVADHAEIADVLEPVYDALDVPFDPDAVGSVARSGGTDDPDTVVEALTDALVGDREPVDEPLPEPSRD
jgi:octanoyl-[GcvH]:protein N-octanoyltransferase